MKRVLLCCIFIFVLFAPSYALSKEILSNTSDNKLQSLTEAQNFEKYYARNEKTRSQRMKSLAYGPSILGFRLGQTYIEAGKNAERLGTGYIIHTGNANSPVEYLRDARYIDILISHDLVRLYTSINFYPTQKYGHFRIRINDHGYVTKIFIDRLGLSMFYSWKDYFIPAISRIIGIKIPCNTNERIDGYGGHHGYEMYCRAIGKGWVINSLEYGDALELIVR